MAWSWTSLLAVESCPRERRDDGHVGPVARSLTSDVCSCACTGVSASSPRLGFGVPLACGSLVMLSSKIQAMMHRDVDGHGIDDHHQRRQSQSTRQLGTYPDAYGGQQADSSQLLQQRRRALAQATSFSEQQDQQRPSAARRAASTGTVNSSAAEAKLLAALRRQTLQDSDENPDGPTSSSSAASTRIPTGTAPPSSDSAANGASDGRALKIRPQIRPWKQTKGKPQDCQ